MKELTPKLGLFLERHLRKISLKWRPRRIAEELSRIPIKEYVDKNPDYKYHKNTKYVYICARCQQGFKDSETEMDHIEPVVAPGKTYKTTPAAEYLKRLFCAVKGYSRLCIPCHDEKTALEGRYRAKFKKNGDKINEFNNLYREYKKELKEFLCQDLKDME